VPPVRREAVISIGAILGSAGLLVLVFWVLRDWPDVSCGLELTPEERQAVDVFRRGYAALHALAVAVLLAVIWRLAAARRGRWRPGDPTLAAITLLSILFAIAAADRETLGMAIVLAFLSVLVVPAAAALLVLAAALLAFARTHRAGAHVVLVVAWLLAAVAVPGHLAAVGFVDEPWCLDETL
jgi:hypothetical protein